MSIKINSKEELQLVNQALTIKKSENKELEIKLLLLQNKYQEKLNKSKSYQQQIVQLAGEWRTLYGEFFKNGSLSKLEEILGYLNFSKTLEHKVKNSEEKLNKELYELQNELTLVQQEFQCSETQLSYLEKIIKEFQKTLNAILELKQQELFTQKHLWENYC